MRRIKLARMNPEQVANEIGDFIINYTFGSKGGVMGLSGGVDSTTVAALTKKAIDRYNQHNKNQLELVGYMLPSGVNNKEDTKDGVYVANKLGIRYEIQNIDAIVNSYKTTNPKTLENNFHKGNLMSEVRASILHRKAATEGKSVIGTGNKDEDFGIGYYTLFGDGAVHMSPIGNLPKRLVREMAAYLGFTELANRIPTAGLEPDQTDFKDLGYSYDVVELITEGINQGFEYNQLINHEQVIPLVNKELEAYEKMYETRKFNSVEDVVNDIYNRHDLANIKANIINPPIAEITLEYR